jgi:hypothetical protein
MRYTDWPAALPVPDAILLFSRCLRHHFWPPSLTSFASLVCRVPPLFPASASFPLRTTSSAFFVYIIMRTLQFAIPCLLACTSESAVPDVTDTLQNILKNTDNSNKYKYPTDLTRGIIPVRNHTPGGSAESGSMCTDSWHGCRNHFIRITIIGETYRSIRDCRMVL